MVATMQRPKTKRPVRGTKVLGVMPGVVEFKLLDEPGAFRATFALFNVKDLDRDVTLPGAFKVGASVRIAQWGHNWGQPAIGKGTIGADGERAWVDGQFNLNMTAGKETYESVKASGDLQQWSYGFDIDKWSVGKFEDEEVRFLEAMTVHEISPVMLGAQPLTSTDQIKTQKVGRRNSAADEEAMRSALDALTNAANTLRQVLGESDDEDDDTDADEENEDGKASKGGSPKAKAGSTEILAARVALELAELGD
jgi:HK97 family phage prohead protease